MNHPISKTEQHRLTREIIKFFAAYYKKLRAEVSRRETESTPAPDFLKGYRKIVTYFCWDGVVVAHHPAEEGAEKDAYTFETTTSLVKEVANRYIPRWMGGEKGEPLVEDYPPGGTFESSRYRDPLQKDHPLVGVTEQSKWTRLDFTNLDDLKYEWRYENEARRQARERAAHHLP